ASHLAGADVQADGVICSFSHLAISTQNSNRRANEIAALAQEPEFRMLFARPALFAVPGGAQLRPLRLCRCLGRHCLAFHYFRLTPAACWTAPPRLRTCF